MFYIKKNNTLWISEGKNKGVTWKHTCIRTVLGFEQEKMKKCSTFSKEKQQKTPLTSVKTKQSNNKKVSRFNLCVLVSHHIMTLEIVLDWDVTIAWETCSHVKYLQARHGFQSCFVTSYLSNSATFPGCWDEVIRCLPWDL